MEIAEVKIFKKLDTPSKIQDYLDSLPFNFEKKGETYRSPREVLKAGEAHCFEGACLALACLHFHKEKAYLLDLKINPRFHQEDADHTVALFKQNGLWGAISKTNHAVLRWRDPIYKSARELATSYFHEYFLNDGRKALISFSSPFDIIRKFGYSWITADDDLQEMAEALDASPHFLFYPRKQARYLKKASSLEIKASQICAS